MNSERIKFISLLEKKYVPPLYEYCRTCFAGHHLPGHDHLHHLRVWYYTRELLLDSPETYEQLTQKSILLLMLAVFFHDTGLTKTLNEDHGVESRKICQVFLTENLKMFPFDINEALKAIESHDKKESELPPGSYSEMNISKLLSICDDIDAYGAIGILRYAEIYLLRGISFADLPGKVIKNISSRFSHISSQNWIPALFLAKHKSRYLYAKYFYKEMAENIHEKENNNVNLRILEAYMNFVYYGKKGVVNFAHSLAGNNNLNKNEFAARLKSDLRQSFIRELNLTNF